MSSLRKVKEWLTAALRNSIRETIKEAAPLVALALVAMVIGIVLWQWQYVTAIAIGSLVALMLATWSQSTWSRWRRYVLPSRFVLLILGVACALFLTEQGKDLGAGLLDAPPRQLVFFGLALLYWATANWHATLVAFDRDWTLYSVQWDNYVRVRYPDQPFMHRWKLDWLVSWWPRLLGSTVYLLATLIIARAGTRTGLDGLVYLPVVLLLGTIIVLMLLDRWMANPDRARRDAASLTLVAAILVACLVGGVIVFYYFLPRGVSLWPHFVAPISAAVFLLLARSGGALQRAYGTAPPPSERRDKPPTMRAALADAVKRMRLKNIRLERPKAIFALWLLAVAAPIAIAAFKSPVWVGEAGAVAIAFFAFGVYMTALETVSLLGGEQTRGTLLFFFLIAVAVGLSRDYHRVRTCEDPREFCYKAQAKRDPATKDTGRVATRPDPRLTVEKAVEVWRAQAALSEDDKTPVPMIVVATAGGGLRAAYWTALMLEKLEEKLGADTFRRHLFAISGVSGGSLGAAFYAAVAKRNEGSGKGAAKLLECLPQRAFRSCGRHAGQSGSAWLARSQRTRMVRVRQPAA